MRTLSCLAYRSDLVQCIEWAAHACALRRTELPSRAHYAAPEAPELLEASLTCTRVLVMALHTVCSIHLKGPHA